MQGKIVKGIAGFYYVHSNKGVFECKAKGAFRNENCKPLVGDNVEFDILDEEKLLGNIVKILPRHSELIRPAVANVDQALVIFSVVSPKPNFNLLDRFLILMGQQKLPCVICFNKRDLDDSGQGEEYQRIYEAAGYHTVLVSANTKQGVDTIRQLLEGKTTTVAGPSGVGKSSLVNCLQNGTVMETGQISKKIERGKHTTRHSEFLVVGDNTYLLDTPGFSSLSLFLETASELAVYYPEFAPYEKYCRFGGCSHITEPVCGIRDGVKEGRINALRYDNYCKLYEELKNKKKY